jgi:hypothetical protein
MPDKIVRLWNGEYWIDISKALSPQEAQNLWDKHTNFGTKHSQYSHGDYFRIFPAKTRMLFDSP